MRTTLCMLAVLLLAPGVARGQAATDSARAAEVRAVVHAFHEALAAGDSTGALALLHDDAVIYEAGHAETRAEYRSGHLRSDIAFAQAVRRRTTAEHAEVWGDAALYTSESHATGTWRDRQIDSRGAETMVLVRTPEGWRIRHVHWSSR